MKILFSLLRVHHFLYWHTTVVDPHCLAYLEIIIGIIHFLGCPELQNLINLDLIVSFASFVIIYCILVSSM